MGQITRMKVADIAKLPPRDLQAAIQLQHEEALRKRREADELVRATSPTKAGRPPLPRCACGKYTASQADKKGHACQ